MDVAALLLLIALQPAVAPAPAQQAVLQRGWSGCFLRSDAEKWPAPFAACFHPSDYPMAAYAAQEQGIVGVRLTIVGAAQPETRCDIIRTSGSASLDRETCFMLRQRVIPTHSSVPRVVTGDVRWNLPASPPVDTREPLATYFSADDYPPSAVRGNEQGTASIVMAIAADGRVTNCALSQSSGSPALDAATCRIMRERARFQPARDEAGNAVPGRMAGSITWSMPSE
jgi:TonB family protein